MSIWELAIVAIVALLVLGPERLPSAARTAGKWFAKAKQISDKLQHDIREQLKIEELNKNIARAKQVEKHYQSRKPNHEQSD